MVQLNASLAKLVKNDVIEGEEAYIKAIDKDDLISRFRKEHIPVPGIALPAGAAPEEEGRRRKKRR